MLHFNVHYFQDGAVEEAPPVSVFHEFGAEALLRDFVIAALGSPPYSRRESCVLVHRRIRRRQKGCALGPTDG